MLWVWNLKVCHYSWFKAWTWEKSSVGFQCKQFILKLHRCHRKSLKYLLALKSLENLLNHFHSWKEIRVERVILKLPITTPLRRIMHLSQYWAIWFFFGELSEQTYFAYHSLNRSTNLLSLFAVNQESALVATPRFSSVTTPKARRNTLLFCSHKHTI